MENIERHSEGFLAWGKKQDFRFIYNKIDNGE